MAKNRRAMRAFNSCFSLPLPYCPASKDFYVLQYTQQQQYYWKRPLTADGFSFLSSLSASV